MTLSRAPDSVTTFMPLAAINSQNNKNSIAQNKGPNMTEEEILRRNSDLEIPRLITRCDAIEVDIRKLWVSVEDLRKESEAKNQMEARRFTELSLGLDRLSIQIEGMKQELTQPMETYRTYSYGLKFLKFIVLFVKWASPVILFFAVIGLLAHGVEPAKIIKLLGL